MVKRGGCIYIITNKLKTTLYIGVTSISREKQIKKWRRDKKEILINSTNPYWKDLWGEIKNW